MSIELTPSQAESLALDPESPVAVIDPITSKTYRLVPQELFDRYERLLDDSPWTAEESATLAGIAFAKLDDTDYNLLASGTMENRLGLPIPFEPSES